MNNVLCIDDTYPSPDMFKDRPVLVTRKLDFMNNVLCVDDMAYSSSDVTSRFTTVLDSTKTRCVRNSQIILKKYFGEDEQPIVNGGCMRNNCTCIHPFDQNLEEV
jgi:hypothetical protein